GISQFDVPRTPHRWGFWQNHPSPESPPRRRADFYRPEWSQKGILPPSGEGLRMGVRSTKNEPYGTLFSPNLCYAALNRKHYPRLTIIIKHTHSGPSPSRTQHSKLSTQNMQKTFSVLQLNKAGTAEKQAF
ncbi:MAG: hypothetical protein KC615_25920, partial [Anaerolineae bacterium]|nr:hypothetical protein [Anaerolineae bacterium]